MNNVKNIIFSSFMLLALTAQAYGMEEKIQVSPDEFQFQVNRIGCFFNAIKDGNVTQIKDMIAQDKNIVNARNFDNTSVWEMVQHHIKYENWPYTNPNGKMLPTGTKIIQFLEDAGVDKTIKKPRWLVEEKTTQS